MIDSRLCPCQSEKPFSTCCKPLLSGEGLAETAEILMRSRFTAYVKHYFDYLLQTWHPSTRPQCIDPTTIPDWFHLTVKSAKEGGAYDTRGQVEFIATARSQAGIVSLHEVSSFVKENGQWLYVDGEIRETENTRHKAGRNDPCPCGSGKKYKKCCYR